MGREGRGKSRVRQLHLSRPRLTSMKLFTSGGLALACMGCLAACFGRSVGNRTRPSNVNWGISAVRTDRGDGEFVQITYGGKVGPVEEAHDRGDAFACPSVPRNDEVVLLSIRETVTSARCGIDRFVPDSQRTRSSSKALQCERQSVRGWCWVEPVTANHNDRDCVCITRRLTGIKLADNTPNADYVIWYQ